MNKPKAILFYCMMLICAVARAVEQPEFVPAIVELSGGELPPTATVAACKQWWKKNKKKFELPGQADAKQTQNGERP